MIQVEAPFPHVGSYALYIDTTLPVGLQRAELVRIQRRDDERLWCSFPLRVGASGNKILMLEQLIDATPLTAEERREHADLERHLLGRTRLSPRLREMAVRSEGLRKRAIYSMILESEKAKLANQLAKAQPSIGQRLPRQAA